MTSRKGPAPNATRAASGAFAWGAESMVGPLRDVLVKAPGPAFGRAHEVAAAGFLHPVDLARARDEHDRLVTLLETLGVRVHRLDSEIDDPDLVYVFDPILVTRRGVILLRPGKANRAGEPAVLEAWASALGIPIAGRIEPPGTIEGGDTLWLRPGLLCAGRSLRTSDQGIAQLARLVDAEVRVFDLPYWRGPGELVHLLSVISPVADDLAVVYLPLLPVGLHALLVELGVRLVEVPDDEYRTLGSNVLVVRPGVVVVADGNPVTRQRLEAAGCEVHALPLGEVGQNGSGGLTCLTRPILRA
jgi:dimethylargininase